MTDVPESRAARERARVRRLINSHDRSNLRAAVGDDRNFPAPRHQRGAPAGGHPVRPGREDDRDRVHQSIGAVPIGLHLSPDELFEDVREQVKSASEGVRGVGHHHVAVPGEDRLDDAVEDVAVDARPRTSLVVPRADRHALQTRRRVSRPTRLIRRGARARRVVVDGRLRRRRERLRLLGGSSRLERSPSRVRLVVLPEDDVLEGTVEMCLIGDEEEGKEDVLEPSLGAREEVQDEPPGFGADA